MDEGRPVQVRLGGLERTIKALAERDHQTLAATIRRLVARGLEVEQGGRRYETRG